MTYTAIQSPWVVVPTYNERSNIERLFDGLKRQSVAGLHILVVDDGSPDGTGEYVQSVGETDATVHLLAREKKEGLGRAYVAGFRHALESGADAVVQMDADLSHDSADVPRLLKALESADVAIGSRYSNGISVINWPLKRLLISIAGNWYARIVTGLPFHDVTGGFKAWRADALRGVNLETVNADGYGFQVETTFRSHKRGRTIVEVPIIFTERRDGQSKMTYSIIREAIWLMWKLRLFGK